MLHVPQISHNLLSVHQFAKDNQCNIVFDSDGFVIQDKLTHKILHQGPCVKGLYPIQHYSDDSCHALLGTTEDALLWHKRLGHPSPTLMKQLIKLCSLPISGSMDFHCTPCRVAKSHKLPFFESHTLTSRPFELGQHQWLLLEASYITCF